MHGNGVIALFEFEQGESGVRISSENHYKLVPLDEVTVADLKSYQQRAAGHVVRLRARF